ncbi:MAG: tRNA (guanosine(46)-N7)-methyltransferase TrmB [Bacillales bacterium]|nr:tRNA (guanosine(46)-N7)-methyltransferase TrmB [Bacillales bacterium]
MRLRNVVGAKDIINANIYINRGIDELPNKKTYLEIGMGKGDFIIANAKRYPNINFIGVEKYDSVLVRAIEKIDEDLPNLKLLRLDANTIDTVFNKNIDLIYLNFSDPWPKKRHALRRLTSPIFLEKYDKIFKKDAHIIMKTDNRKLFEYSLKSLTDYGYKIEDISLDLHNDEYPDNIMTEYEQRFVSLNKNIYMVNVKKTIKK